MTSLRYRSVIGETDAHAARSKMRPYTPANVLASLYQHLGIDSARSFLDHQGRPMPILPFGEPIQELLPTRA